MAASFGTATASATENALKSSPYLPLSRRPLLSSSSKVSFRLSHKSKLRFSSKVMILKIKPLIYDFDVDFCNEEWWTFFLIFFSFLIFFRALFVL